MLLIPREAVWREKPAGYEKAADPGPELPHHVVGPSIVATTLNGHLQQHHRLPDNPHRDIFARLLWQDLEHVGR